MPRDERDEHAEHDARGDRSAEPKPAAPALNVLDLPPELHSHIASFLPLPTLLRFLALHSSLLSLTQTHLSPIRPAVLAHLSAGPPYPRALAALPSLALLAPPRSHRRAHVDVLVRARPRWVLERLELGAWPDDVWEDAYARRFLPSWKRFKTEDDTWRAVFLRMLGRLEHRYNGCTHDESWTRFITLHKNGSASLNRVYSRMFDPYEIYDELKHQNNHAQHETHVRVVCHLQDVRVLALGVVVDHPSLSVNANAHAVLHPPHMRPAPVDSRRARGEEREPQRPAPARHTATDVPRSTARARSPPLAQPHRDPSAPSSPPPPARAGTSPSLRSAISSWIPARVRRVSDAREADADDPPAQLTAAALAAVNSPAPAASSSMLRGGAGKSSDGRRRSWSLSRARTPAVSSRHSLAGPAPAPVLVPDSPPINSANVLPATARGQRPATPVMPTLPETPGQRNAARADRSGSSTAVAVTRPPSPALPKPTPVARLAYVPMTHPTPATSHALYPNLTPSESFMVCVPRHPARAGTSSTAPGTGTGGVGGALQLVDSSEDGRWIVGHADRRGLYTEAPDDLVVWGAEECDGTRMAEVTDNGQRRWVGSMILVAQLHPTDRREAHPAGSNPAGPVEGADVDLGPRGMYASLGFEDVDALFPWVRLKSAGAYSADPRRSGMGFE
ncbi:hypothetical protein Q5752_000888 [Cryptotrichosporon argae]